MLLSSRAVGRTNATRSAAPPTQRTPETMWIRRSVISTSFVFKNDIESPRRIVNRGGRAGYKRHSVAYTDCAGSKDRRVHSRGVLVEADDRSHHASVLLRGLGI